MNERDHIETVSRRNPHARRLAWVCGAALAVALSLTAAEKAADPETEFEAALHREMVMGDLAGAIEQYRAILSRPAADRSVAARALYQVGECLEKLAQRAEARAAYARLAAGFADQTNVASKARAKLASWTDAPPGPRNLGFDEGKAGWLGGGLEVRRRGCRGAAGCGLLAGPMRQTFSATAYRGKTVRLRAYLRLDRPGSGGSAMLWLRADPAGYSGSLESGPIASAQWTPVEIAGEIHPRAVSLEIGVSAAGGARVWVDEAGFEIVPQAEVDAVRETIRRQYSPPRFTPDEDSSPATLSGARCRIYDVTRPLSELPGRGQTELILFRLSGASATAVVRLDSGSRTSTWRDSWVRQGSGWKLAERVFLGSRERVAPTDAGTVRLVAADLKQLAAPLATPEPGHTFYDLAPLGNAVGESRLVVLGEASRGTHECLRLEHRVLEYLVKERGFTVLAMTGDPAGGQAIDRYVKTGLGDPRRALASLDSWAWNTQEALDVVEWIRTYNQARGARPVLSFAAWSPLRTQRPDAGKTVLWTGKDTARTYKGQGAFVAAFALHRGGLRAAGVENGDPGAVAPQTITPLAEGAGDQVLAAAGMPMFFLDLRTVPPMTTLGLWLAESHLFLTSGVHWNRDDPQTHFKPEILAQAYDALIFVGQGRAARNLEESHASNF